MAMFPIPSDWLSQLIIGILTVIGSWFGGKKGAQNGNHKKKSNGIDGQ